MPASRPVVLVVGASGRLGREVVPLLAAHGYAVRGAARHAVRVPAPAIPVRADLLDPASLRAACRGVDVVVMAAGAPLTLRPILGHPGFHAVDGRGTVLLVRVARELGVTRFVYVSVYAPPGFAGGPYVAAHREAAEAVRASGMAWSVVQPTGFFSTFEVLLPLARLGLIPEIGDGAARTNPIHERDLAEVVLRAVEGQEGDVPVGGPEVLSRRQIAEAAFAAVGRAPRMVHLPDALLRLGRWLAAPADRRLAELLRFLDAVSRTDVVAPAAGVRTLAAHLRERARRTPA